MPSIYVPLNENGSASNLQWAGEMLIHSGVTQTGEKRKQQQH
jgi:hypothetical protein